MTSANHPDNDRIPVAWGHAPWSKKWTWHWYDGCFPNPSPTPRASDDATVTPPWIKSPHSKPHSRSRSGTVESKISDTRFAYTAEPKWMSTAKPHQVTETSHNHTTKALSNPHSHCGPPPTSLYIPPAESLRSFKTTTTIGRFPEKEDVRHVSFHPNPRQQHHHAEMGLETAVAGRIKITIIKSSKFKCKPTPKSKAKVKSQWMSKSSRSPALSSRHHSGGPRPSDSVSTFTASAKPALKGGYMVRLEPRPMIGPKIASGYRSRSGSTPATMTQPQSAFTTVPKTPSKSAHRPSPGAVDTGELATPHHAPYTDTPSIALEAVVSRLSLDTAYETADES